MDAALYLLAADKGDEGETITIFCLGVLDQLTIGNITPLPHGIHQYYILELVPNLPRLDDGEEGSHAGTGSQKPQVVSSRYLFEGEAALGELLNPHRVTRLQA